MNRFQSAVAAVGEIRTVPVFGSPTMVHTEDATLQKQNNIKMKLYSKQFAALYLYRPPVFRIRMDPD